MMKAQPAKVFIVDDDEAVRDSLAVLVETRGVSATVFSSGGQFLDAYSPDWTGCAFIDVRMPGIDGLEVQRQLNERKAHLNVIIMTAHGDVPMAVRAMKAGAVDFLEKPIEPERLIDALHRHMGAKSTEASTSSDTLHARTLFGTLTTREREVLNFLVKGAPNKVIAHEMQVSPRTVELHRAHVMQKMEAKSLSHLVRMALSIGIDPSI